MEANARARDIASEGPMVLLPREPEVEWELEDEPVNLSAEARELLRLFDYHKPTVWAILQDRHPKKTKRQIRLAVNDCYRRFKDGRG